MKILYLIKFLINTQTKTFNPCLSHFRKITRLPHMGLEDPNDKNRYKKETI